MAESKKTDYKNDYPVWDKSMKSTHKILIPDMLPWHFLIIQELLKMEGYDVEILKNESRAVIDEGFNRSYFVGGNRVESATKRNKLHEIYIFALCRKVRGAVKSGVVGPLVQHVYFNFSYTQIKIDEINNLGVVKIRLRSMLAAIEAFKRV